MGKVQFRDGSLTSRCALSGITLHEKIKTKAKEHKYIYIYTYQKYIYIYIYIYVVAYHGSIGIYSPLPSRPVDAPEKSCG